MASPSSSASLEQTSHISIAELSPSLAEPASRALKAIVTLTWPFSSATGSVAFLLSEPDFRLRRSRGQVRVQFAGSCARHVAKSQIASGDEVILCLDGVEWIQDSKEIATPGMGVEFELRFTERVLLKFRQEDSPDSVLIDLDHPSAESELPIASVLPDTVPEPILLPTPTTNGVATRSQTEESEDTVYSSPAFVKRARTSYGSLFELDPFSEEDGTIKGKGRKRTRLSSAWTYMSRSPTPERELSIESEPVNEISKPIMTDEGCQTMEMDFNETGGAAETLASLTRQSTNIGSAPYAAVNTQHDLEAQSFHSSTNLSMPPPPKIQLQLPERDDSQFDEHQNMPRSPRLQPLSPGPRSLVSPLTLKGLVFDATQVFPTTEFTFGEGRSQPEVSMLDGSLVQNGHGDFYSASPSRDGSYGNPTTEFQVSSAADNGFAAPESETDEGFIAQDLYNRLCPPAHPSKEKETVDEERSYAEGDYTGSPRTQDDIPGASPLPTQMKYPDLEEPSKYFPIPHWGAPPPDLAYADIDVPNMIENERINSRPVSSAEMSRTQSARSQLKAEVVDLTESSDEDAESNGARALEYEQSSEQDSAGAESEYNRQFVGPRIQADRVGKGSVLMEDEEAEEEEFSDGEDEQGNAYRRQTMQGDEEMEAEGSEEEYDEYEGLEMDENGNYMDQDGNIVYPERRTANYYDEETEEGESEGSYEDDMEDIEAPHRPQQSGPPVIIDLLSSDDEEEPPPAKVREPKVPSRQAYHRADQSSVSEEESTEDENFTELQGNPLSDEEPFDSESEAELPPTLHRQDNLQSENEDSESEGSLAPEINTSHESLNNDESTPKSEVVDLEDHPTTVKVASSLPEALQKHTAEGHQNMDLVIEAEALEDVNNNDPVFPGQETESSVGETLERTNERSIDPDAKTADHVLQIEEAEENSLKNLEEVIEPADIMDIDQEDVTQEPTFHDTSEEYEYKKVIHQLVVKNANEKDDIEAVVTQDTVTQDATEVGGSVEGLSMDAAQEDTATSIEEDGMLLDKQEDETWEEATEMPEAEEVLEGENGTSPRSCQGQPEDEVKEDTAEPNEEPMGSPLKKPVDEVTEEFTDEISEKMVAEAVANPASTREPGEILVKKPAEETVEEEFQDIVVEAEKAAETEDSSEESVKETLEKEFEEIVAGAVEEAVEEVAAIKEHSQEPPNGKHTSSRSKLLDEHPHTKLRNAKHINPAKDIKEKIPHFTRSKGAATSPPKRVLGLDGAMDDETAIELPARSQRASTQSKKQLPTPDDSQITHMTISAGVSFASALDSQGPVAGAHGTSVKKMRQVAANEEITDAIPPSLSDPAFENSNIENSPSRPRTRSRKAVVDPEPILEELGAEKAILADEALPERKPRGRPALRDKATKTSLQKATSSKESSPQADAELSPEIVDETRVRRSHRRAKSSTSTAEIKEGVQSKATTVHTMENVPPHTPLKSNRRTTSGSSQAQASTPLVLVDERPIPEGHDASVAMALSTLESPSKPHELVNPSAKDVKAKIQIARHLRTQLKGFAALKILKFNRGKKLDVMAIVTSTPPEPHRAKGGPRHYQITFNITDVSIAPNEVIQTQVSRPYKEALPIVKVGDGILLLGFHVHPASKGAFQLRSDQTESSSWSVFKDGGEVETRGPPTEYGQEEAAHIASLKDWFSTLDETAQAKLKRANEKWD